MAQIGTVRLETQNSGVVDVPVFEPGDSASGIYEFVRVETASGPGFIPVTDPVDATYPYLRVQSQNNGIVAVTDTPGSDIPDSGVSRWTFDDADTESGTALDVWGSNDATINGATTGVTGQYNEAYDFDGTDDNVVDSDPSAEADLGVWSVSAWINGDSFNGSRVFQKRDGETPDINWTLGVDNSGNPFSNHTIGGTFNTILSSNSLNTGTLYHLVGVNDGSDLRLYINASKETNAGAGGTSDQGSGQQITVGSEASGASYFDGVIDDPRLYSKALTDTEVSNLYNTGSIDG